MLLIGRPHSILEPTLQSGKPPVLICPPVLILMLSSGFSMLSRAKKTLPETLLFPVALPLLTLPTTMPLIFSFCSPFSLAKVSTAICKLSSSTASGPDQIAYPLLKHLPEPAQLLLLSLFNRSWYSHTFPSCWKPTTIIPIHKSGKFTSSPSSFRPISLTSCISKLFERLILSRLTFHLESNYLHLPGRLSSW